MSNFSLVYLIDGNAEKFIFVVFKSFLEKCYAAAGKYEQEIVDFKQLGDDQACLIGIVTYFDANGKVIQQLK